MVRCRLFERNRGQERRQVKCVPGLERRTTGTGRPHLQQPSSSQRWYVAVLVISSRVADEASGQPLLDLQYRLVRALTNDDAYERALAMGRQEAHSYLNADGRTVTWECLGLHDLSEIQASDLSDGTGPGHRSPDPG